MGWISRFLNGSIPRQDNYNAALRAIESGDSTELESLLRQNPALIRQAYCTSGSLLHNAAYDGQAEIAEMLIARGASVNGPSTRDKETPLHFAAMGGQLETARVLVEHGADIEAISCGYNALGVAAWSGKKAHKDVVRYLLSKGAKHSGIHVAALLGDTELAHEALAGGADVNSKDSLGRTPLQWAVRGEDTAQTMVDFLLANGADVEGRRTDKVSSPLSLAASMGLYSVAETLIAHGADVNAEGIFGSTPLQLATSGEHPDLAKLLLASGACAFAASAFRMASIHEAVSEDDVDLLEQLLANGADPNAMTNLVGMRGPNGQRMWKMIPRSAFAPLHIAADNGYARAAQALIDHGAHVDKQDSQGQTALHHAAPAGHTETIKVLLSNGADPMSKDHKGRTPIDLAIKAGHDEVASVLRDRTAQ